ncbi:MAG: 1-acyl-sn-glycerol-3-phosphate acyltransferase [Parachlamydiales bacterium]
MSNSNFIKRLQNLFEEKKISKKYFDNLSDFYFSYKNATKELISQDDLDSIFDTLIDLLFKEIASPFKFLPFHQKITHPFNYQKFSIDFLKPLVDLEKSKLYGLNNLEKIKKYIENKENVILLANHQSEVDPMLIYIMLEEKYYDIAKDVIYVAGDRVTNDFLAIPFSMGCNLLCIYSKRYIDIDLSLKHKKQIHNKKVMSLMSSLLSQGGKTIYVAPSGGRDRKNEKGIIEVAPFDPQSLEMFYLMCKKSKNKSHFFPLALSTYDILPPPEKIQIEMGEKREVNRGFIALSFLEEIDMDNVPGSEDANKINKRKNRAKYIHNIVKEEYARISKEK